MLQSNNALPADCFIQNLPVEILSQIFQLGQLLGCHDHPSSKPFEVVLSHVSSLFRKIAIQNHSLWSCISVAPSLSPVQFQTYLQRSSGRQLDVKIDSIDTCMPCPSTMAKINLITPSSHKYRKLIINSLCESANHPLLRRFCDITMPDLQHLSLSIDEIEGYNSFNLDNGIIQGGAPNLAFVRLRGLALPLFLPPLAQVTTLHLDQTAALPILYNTFRSVVIAPHVLVNLSIYGDIINSSHTSNSWSEIDNPIILPHLRSLRICGVNGYIYSGLLLTINAPALDSLVLKDLQDHDLDRFWTLTSPRRRFPSLRNLTLLDSQMSTDSYLNVLQGFRHITSFTTGNDTRLFVKLLLSMEPRDGIVWPMMHTLAFYTNVQDIQDLILNLVEHRIDMGCPLTMLRLGTFEPLSSLPHYQRLKEKVGLEAFVALDGWPASNADFETDPGDDLFF